ncbi:MAG: thioesterase domain-containing protein [Xanthomonadales bacterium]|jgi:thioesterase domain-containing protein|nr:thioesterase domain-containing protein [Xanthomonadales bacterium]
MAAPLPTDRAGLEAFFHASIPLTAAQGLTVAALTPSTVELRAPLAPNVNDKGCAFGGGLGSLLTLAAWSLPATALARAGLSAEVYIQDATQKYLAPVWGELMATAELSEATLGEFLDAFRSKGKARLTVRSCIHYDGAPAATLEARFVALKPR